MPTYDFVCNNCDHEFEIFLARIITEEDKVCPECGSSDVRQRITSFRMAIGCGSTGKGNIGPRMDGKPSLAAKYMKYRDPKYQRDIKRRKQGA